MKRQALIGALVIATALAAAPTAPASWLFQGSPMPTGADTWELNGVSCTSKTLCTAVGSYSDATGSHPMAENRSGTTWTIVSVPVPSGATGVQLADVSCTAASACIAVGHYDHAGDTLTIAERWNGTSWTIQSTPNPAGATATQLDSISCVSTTACVAVGHSAGSTTTTTLAERWNGASWAIQSTPNPTGFSASELNGVSCPSAGACVAVGDSSNGSNSVTLAERWNGTSWVIQSTPKPSGATASKLFDVSCTSASACTAGGSGLAERWNGTSWSLQ